MLEVIKLFVRRMLMGKGAGIPKIPPQKAVDDFANDLYKKFKQNGVSDEAVTNPNDVKAIWNQITNREAQIFTNNLKDALQKPDPFKKAGEVFDLKGKKIKNPDNIMGGEEIIETDAQILARLKKVNKESLSNMRYEAHIKVEEAKAAADEDYIMKIFDPEDFATGGRAGLYRGGQAEIEPSLSDIGHGSDALMARNALLTPGSQATTSTGLNYLLGEDNDTTRVPYGEGKDVKMILPKEKPMDEYMLKKLMSQAGAETLDARTRDMFIQEYKKKIREKNSKADGGQINKPKRGLVDEAGSYAGLSSIVNLGYHGTSPAIADAITASGFTGGKVPTWAGKGNVFTSPNINVASRYGPSKLGVVTSAKNLTSPIGGGFNKSGISFGKEIVSSPTQATKGMNFYNRLMSGKYPNSALANKLLNTGTTAVKKSVNTLAPKFLGGLGFLFDAAPANADEIDMTTEDFIKMRHINKKKQEKIKQETATFKQIRDTEAAEAAAAAAEASQRQQTTQMAAQNKAAGIGGYQSSFGQDKGFMEGSGTAADMGSFAQGGPARQNFGLGRRAFLKLIGSGAATVGAAKSGLFSLLKGGASKKAATEIATSAGSGTPPPYFFKLVEKIKKLGNDVTETGALAERQKVKQYKDFTLTEDTATGRIEVQKVKPFAEGSDNFGNGLTEEVYMGYTPGETIVVKGKPVKKGPEYDEGTAYLRNDGPQTGEVYDEMTGVTDDILEEVGEAVVKKADGGRIGYNLGSKVIGKGIAAVTKKAGEGKFTKNEVLLNMFQNTIKQSKSPDTKKRFINFIEEIKLKPELSKDPNVWNFFTKGLPKNQKLVVYGDDTVDFWTQSEFGPHNIATSAKFQKKHPYLTKDQAVKIQNMEPEDQIFEMKRLEVLRKRTANATGGRVPMVFGGGIFKTIIKNLAKAKGVNPSEYLKVTNYKTLPSEVRNLMSKADFEKMKAGRIEMFENWVEMAKSRKEFLRNIEEGKKSPAAPIFENLEQSFKSPVPSSVTDKDILQGEFILKNLKTKDRKLHSSGGIAAMLGE